MPFFERVLASAPFRSGTFDTSFVPTHWSVLSRDGADGESAARAELAPLALAAAAAELWRREGSNADAAGPPPSRWRLAGVAEAHRERL